jgi:hypothetical protein
MSEIRNSLTELNKVMLTVVNRVVRFVTCTQSTVSSYSVLTKRHTISYTSKPRPEMHFPPEMVN